MKKRIKKKIKKLKKSINKINKVRVQKGRKAMLQETWATVTYGLYDNRKIRRLKKFPPALVENRMLFETNDDFTDNGRALFDYLIEKGYNKKYEIVWLVHEPSKYKEYQFENVKFVQNFKKGSTIRRAEAYKYALTSKYIFYTQAFNWIGMSRRNQLFIDLWHGCGYKANKNGVTFMPGKAANAGGVATSALEMCQNSARLSWTAEEVDTKLHQIMVDIFHKVDDASKRYDMEGNYVAGANIAGFEKVVDAMIAQGIV